MDERLSIGKILFHKYFGNVIVVQIGDNLIKVDTGSKGF